MKREKYPEGYVTFVYTDIEGSSSTTEQMADQHGAGAFEAREREEQRGRLEAARLQHNGHEMNRAGDGHLYVFQEADDALAFAVAVQGSLAETPITAEIAGKSWTLKVRIGMHTSPSQLRLLNAEPRAFEYHDGRPANYGSRIVGLAAGGQILISEETFQRAGSAKSYETVPWKNRYLKSFPGPHTVHEVLYPKGPQSTEPGMRYFPAWFSGEQDRYIPRLEKEQEVTGPFQEASPDGHRVRLVTVHAEGGMGKTRLAVACAVQMVGLFSDHVHFVPLAGVSTTAQAVAEAISRELGFRTPPLGPAELQQHLRERNTLLVLDNYETVASTEVRHFFTDVLSAAPHVRLLVASRALVGIFNLEQEVKLDEGMAPDEARDLFLKRAGLPKQPTGTLSKTEDALVNRIVAAVYWIPLAVELASAWVGRAALARIAEGLENAPLERYTRLPDGTNLSGDPATRQRQQSMVHCIEHSWNLLTPRELRLFAACGLFALGGTFDAATVAAITKEKEEATEDGLIALADASLIRRAEEPETIRYHLHRFTREYARHRLDERPEVGEVMGRFLAHYAAIVPRNDQWINDDVFRTRLDREWRHALAAFDLADARGDHATLWRLANIFCFLGPRGHWSEEERVLIRARDIADTVGERRGEGVWLCNLGSAYRYRGRWEDALQTYAQALGIFREMSDRYGEGLVFNNMGNVYRLQSRFDNALYAFGQSLEIRRELGDRYGEGQTLNNMGNVYLAQGRQEDALCAYERSLEIRRELGDRYGQGTTLGNLGLVYQDQERWPEAVEALERDLAIARELGDRYGEGQTLNNLGNLFQRLGRVDEAMRAFEGDLSICRELGDIHGEGIVLHNLALLWARRGEVERALPFARAAVAALERTEDAAGLAQARETLARLEGAEGT